MPSLSAPLLVFDAQGVTRASIAAQSATTSRLPLGAISDGRSIPFNTSVIRLPNCGTIL